MSERFQSRLKTSSGGVALIELAIQLPIYLLLFGLFFDVMSGYISKAHSEMASLSLMANFKRAPQTVDFDSSSGSIAVRDLTLGELAVFQDDFHSILKNSMRNAGSFADSKSNIAMSIFAINIDQTTGLMRVATPRYSSIGVPFYTTPQNPDGSVDCFGTQAEVAHYASELADFANTKLREVDQLASAGIPIGKPLPTFAISGATSLPYLQKRTMIVYMTCYKPQVSFFERNPRISKFVWFPGKEIEISVL